MMSDQYELEARLGRVAAQFPYPPTPNITAALRRRATRRATARPRVRWQAALAVGVCVLLLLWPFAAPIRAAVERLLRIGAVEIVVATPVPVPPMPATALPEASTALPEAATALPEAATVPPASDTLELPTQLPARTPALTGATTLADAQRRVPWTIRLPAYPADLGAPDQVFLQDLDGTSLVMLWLEPDTNAPRLSLQILDSDIMARKFLVRDEDAQHTTVGGMDAVWIDVPHVLEYTIPNGGRTLREGRFVEGNVLIWFEDDLTYRLESGLSLDEARRVAESLR
jgi:hypothetical protein